MTNTCSYVIREFVSTRNFFKEMYVRLTFFFTKIFELLQFLLRTDVTIDNLDNHFHPL
jgi:hypothetical protein